MLPVTAYNQKFAFSRIYKGWNKMPKCQKKILENSDSRYDVNSILKSIAGFQFEAKENGGIRTRTTGR